MAKKYSRLILVLATVLVLFASPQTENQKPMPNVLGSDKTVLIPDSFLRGFDPVTVFFNRAVGPSDGGPIDNPGSLLKITPEHPGEYRFLDGRTLQFRPAVAWPALAAYTFTVESQTFRLITLMSPPSKIEPAASSLDLDPIANIDLYFSDPIHNDKLAAMITFDVKPLPGLGESSAYKLTAKDFDLKDFERPNLSKPVHYRLTFHKPVGFGYSLTMNLQLAADNRFPGTLQRYSFFTRPNFKLTGIGSGTTTYPVAAKGSVYSLDQAIDCGEGPAALCLKFSGQPAPLTISAIKQMVRFEPSVRDLSFEISGNCINLNFKADANKAYKIKLNYLAIRNTYGDALAPIGDTSAFFFFRQPVPYIRWLASQGILERFGPQMFPVEGRSMQKTDVRIFKIDPLDRRFWPFPSDPVSVNEAKRPASPGEEPGLMERYEERYEENQEYESQPAEEGIEPEEGEESEASENRYAPPRQANYGYAANMAEHIKLIGTPLVSKIMPLPLKSDSRKWRFGIDVKTDLAHISGADAPGTYLVGYRTIGQGSERLYIRIQVTDLDLSVVEEENAATFVVTSLKTGLPVANAEVWVEGECKGTWDKIISGTTDANGRFRFVHNRPIPCRIRRVGVRSGNDTLVLDPENAPPEFANNHWFPSHNIWFGWLNSLPRQERAKPVRMAHILTERPVYRPEEPVHIKGYIRVREAGNIIPDTTGNRTSLIVHAPGEKNWTFPITLTSMGSFYKKFEAQDLPSGDYQAEVFDEKEHVTLAQVSFKVESYRIPTFEVLLSGPDETGLDEPFKINLMANYYAGGRVTGQEVEWKVTQSLHHPSIPDFPGFVFSSHERFSGNQPFTASGSVNKKDVTDDNGSASLKIDPTDEEDGRPRRYMVEATVRGADEMTVTAIKEVFALPPLFLGLKVPRLVKTIVDLKAEALLLGLNRKPLAGKDFSLRVFRREWHSYLQESDFSSGRAKYINDVVDRLILEKTMTSTGKPQPLALDLREAGVYVIEISARDKLGRLMRVSQDFYLAGEKTVSWKKPTANVFETLPDREFYYPGQRAQIVLKSPFQNARALVVVEGPSANTYHWLDVVNGQALFEISVESDMTPRIPVHFLLMRGRIPAKTENLQSGSEDRGKPLTMGNTTWLAVRPRSNELRVGLTHPEQCLPAAKITVKIALSDPDGKPINGEVALWLVDRAVLALGVEKPLDPLPSFISAIDSILRIRNTRNQTVGNISIDEIPGGEAAKPEEESLFDNVTVRKNFQTVPYYNPAIVVTNGMAEVTIDMPDNLTDFAIRAVATNGRERFGAAKSKISVRLPLLVQPALPRFVRPGDRFSAGGIGRMIEGNPGPGRAEIQVQGLVLGGNAKLPVQWVKDRAERLYYPLSLPLEKSTDKNMQVTVRMAVVRDADGAKDAFEVKLPVRPDVARRQIETFARLAKDKPIPFPTPEEPARPGSLRQQAVITHEAALLKMLAALDYLSEYPYGCTEQRVSKILPEFALKDVLTYIGREDRGKAMDHFIRETLAYLETVLTPAGLYSYWPGSEGYVSLTAYVTEFLVRAQKAGYSFKKELLDRAVNALKESLRSDYSRFIDGCSYIERAEALNALAIAGHYDKSYALDLQARAVNMDLYSEANILHAFLQHDSGNRKAIDTLGSYLWKSLIFKLREGQEVYQGMQFREDTFNGLILPSEVKTLASVARTLYLMDAKNQRVKLLFDELISRGEGDGWGSTNANASALLALAQMFQQPQTKHAGQKIAVVFGDKTEMIDTNGKTVVRTANAFQVPGKLMFKEGDSRDMPMVWLTVDYLPAVSGDQVKAKNVGFVVERELLTILGNDRPPVKNRAAAGKSLEYEMGAVIEEHVRVINSENRNYVAVCVPFAAGFEPLNPNLQTSPPEAKPSGTFTRQPSYAAYEDDNVTFYFDTLPKGTFDFYFRLRASFEGSYSHPPARAEMMYKLKVFGQSDGTRVVVLPRPGKNTK